MNRFRKLADGTWGLACTRAYERGEVVVVERKDGSVEDVAVGEYLGQNKFGDHEHRIWNQGQDRAPDGPRPASIGPARKPVAPPELSWPVRTKEPQFTDPDAVQDENPVPAEFRHEQDAKGRIIKTVKDEGPLF